MHICRADSKKRARDDPEPASWLSAYACGYADGAGLFSHAGHSTPRTDLYGEMELAGFQHVERHDFLPVQIFEVFAPAPSP